MKTLSNTQSILLLLHISIQGNLSGNGAFVLSTFVVEYVVCRKTTKLKVDDKCALRFVFSNEVLPFTCYLLRFGI